MRRDSFECRELSMAWKTWDEYLCVDSLPASSRRPSIRKTIEYTSAAVPDSLNARRH
jgi:hypothetical protein